MLQLSAYLVVIEQNQVGVIWERVLS